MSRFAWVKLIPFPAVVLAAATLSTLSMSGCGQVGGDSTPLATMGREARPTKTPGDRMKPQPEDFSVSYEWRAGSMPPPFHYEYSIHIGPGEHGRIVYQPDYDSDKVPTWTETITVTRQHLADLYDIVVDRKLLREKWGKVTDPPVGGSVQWAEITAGGKSYQIPHHLQGFQEEAAATLYDAVRALVPKETWDKLEARREQYVQDYQRKNDD